MKFRCDKIIEQMAHTCDLRSMLAHQNHSVGELLKMLHSKRAKKQIARYRSLARIHGQLLVGRYSPAAVSRLLNLVQNAEQKPEIALRASALLLQLAGVNVGRSDKKLKPFTPENFPILSPDERARILADLERGVDARHALEQLLEDRAHESPTPL